METRATAWRLMFCCRSVLFSPCLLTCVNWNKNQLLFKIKIFSCLRSSFNLVLEFPTSFLPRLLVSDAAKLKTLPSNGKLLKSFSSDCFLFTTTMIIFRLATDTFLLKWYAAWLILSFFFLTPFILTSIPLSHSLGSLNLSSINTLKIKTDPIWSKVISLNLFSDHIMTNNSGLLYNTLRMQVWPGFNLLTSVLVKGEPSHCTVPSPTQLTTPHAGPACAPGLTVLPSLSWWTGCHPLSSNK